MRTLPLDQLNKWEYVSVKGRKDNVLAYTFHYLNHNLHYINRYIVNSSKSKLV